MSRPVPRTYAELLVLWREGAIPTEQLTVDERNRLMVLLLEEALHDEAIRLARAKTTAA